MKIEYNADKGLYQASYEGIKVEGFSHLDALYYGLIEVELQNEQ